MEDSNGQQGLSRDPLLFYVYGSDCFETNNPGEMDMEHLDTFSPSRQEHQEALYLGVKSKSASRRK